MCFLFGWDRIRKYCLDQMFLFNRASKDFSPEGEVGVVPKRECVLTLAYYAFPRRRWNNMKRENRRTRRKTCPSATLSTTNPTWIDPGANPSLSGERPVTTDLSHGTAFKGLKEHKMRIDTNHKVSTVTDKKVMIGL
jgi:hypothetical protein